MKGLTVHFLTSSLLVTRPQEPRARLLYKIVFIGGTAWYSRLVLKDNCNLNKARHVRWVDTAVLSRLSRQNVTTYRNVTVLGMAWHDCRLIEMTSHTTSLTGVTHSFFWKMFQKGNTFQRLSCLINFLIRTRCRMASS